MTSLSSFSFGGASSTNKPASSIFGGSPANVVSSSTDSSNDKKTEAPKSIFGGLNLSTTSNSLFGGSSTASSAAPSLFGGFTSSSRCEYLAKNWEYLAKIWESFQNQKNAWKFSIIKT